MRAQPVELTLEERSELRVAIRMAAQGPAATYDQRRIFASAMGKLAAIDGVAGDLPPQDIRPPPPLRCLGDILDRVDPELRSEVEQIETAVIGLEDRIALSPALRRGLGAT